MDAGASASARPAGLPVHDARPVGCAHPASRARPAGAASHSRKGVGRGLDRPLAASDAGPRPAIRPYTNRYIHCPVRTAGRKVSRCGLPLVAPLDRLNGITGLTWTVTVDLPYADDPIRIIHRSLIFDTQLKVMLTPERHHGSLMAEWPAMGQPDLTLKVNGIKRALSPLVEIDGCAGMPGVFI